MYEMAKYHMRRDIKKVLDWQMKYGKTLKVLSRYYYELDEYENYYDCNDPKAENFNDLRILDFINEKSVPGLQFNLSCYDYTGMTQSINFGKIYFVDELKKLINDHYTDQKINIVYDRKYKMLSVSLYNEYNKEKIISLRKKQIKKMNIKDIVEYQTFTAIPLQTIITKTGHESIEDVIKYHMLYYNTSHIKVYNKHFYSVDSFLKINFEGFKNEKFTYRLEIRDGLNVEMSDGESVEEMIEIVKSLKYYDKVEDNWNDGEEKYTIDIILTKDLSYPEREVSRRISICLVKQQHEIPISSMPIKRGFDGYVWSHGLNAFNDMDPVGNAEYIRDNPETEIACSLYGEELGPIGIYVKGDCHFASSDDVGSTARCGKRYVNMNHMKHELYCPEDFIKYAKDSSNSEGIIKNVKIVGLWVKDHWIKDNEDIVEELMESTGIHEIEII